jgi:uncharacterized protein YndB with AHSA1/START domain
MAKRPTKQATRISDEATVRATGKTSAEWYAMFDKEHAELWSHKERVGFLRRHGVEAGWWQQAITVNYERARGLRLLGQTSGAGFEFGISRTFDVAPERAWNLLTSGVGLEAWAGDGTAVEIVKGAKQQLHGKKVEVRGVTAGIRVRLAVVEPGVPQRAFQMSVVPSASGKASVRFHEENLPGLAARKRADRKWNEIMDEVESILAAG